MSPKASRATRLVALLRGINVGGRNKLPMADLRRIALQCGWTDVATFIQSGNLLFTAAIDQIAAAKTLERAIAEDLGFAVPVVVRQLAALRADLAACPLAAALCERPGHLHLGVSREPFPKSLPAALAPYCKAGEQIAVRGGALWVDFTGGVARSKLTSAVLDRAVGGTVTLRNSRTIAAIAAMPG
ncbi:MAG: DUF1697 domain-containing protein [Planctomycetota bacterium]